MRCEPGVLYECAHPPVTEVIIGVVFEPIGGLDAAHFGAYWERVRKALPNLVVRNPILPPVSEPKVATIQGGETILVHSDPPVRYWFVNEGEDELVQVQSDRFLRNWRKRPDRTSYPRFSELWERFSDSWIGYLAFLDEHGFGLPEVLQCELGYVNRIGTAGRPLAWAIPALAGFGSVTEHVAFEGHRSQVRLTLPGGLGRGQIDVAPDAEGGWRLSLSAKGKPDGGDVQGLAGWLGAARGWLNHVFVSCLGEEYGAEIGVRARP